MISAHQTGLRLATPDKKINIAIFDNLGLCKNHVEIDSIGHPRDSVLKIYEENNYNEEYKDLKVFFKEYIGEPNLCPLISYPDMKTKYPIEITDLRHQLYHITLKKIQLFQEYGTDLDNARLFLVFVRRREIESISDGRN